MMQLTSLALLLPCLPLSAAETVLGAYIFHRHGDRTTKSYTPVTLTSLGADQVYRSGSWYRSRYISDGASIKINGISSDKAVLSQLSVTSPVDEVLQNSAQVFLQGLYPPVGNASIQTLADGTTVEGPLNGYQYIPVNADTTAATSKHAESNGWLQGGSGCPKAVTSSDSYFDSREFLDRLNETKGFYQGLLPVYENTFAASKASFENAYTIYDFVHVSTIHNKTEDIPSNDLLTPLTQHQLFALASEQQWNLAYNETDQIRAVAGSVLAGHVVQELNTTLLSAINKKSSGKRLTVQFGAYGTFTSFFALAQLHRIDPNFHGIVDYASSFAIELVIADDAGLSAPINPDDVSVRFLFVNGTVSDANPPREFPLFAQKEKTLPWTTFVDQMSKFSLKNTEEWCVACGATDGVCAGFSGADDDSSTASVADNKSSGGRVSPVVAGVIGAVVTLVVIAGLIALVLVVGGWRVVNRKTLATALAPKLSSDGASSIEYGRDSK